MESTRLPGKSLAPLRGIPIIDWIVSRTAASRMTDEVVFAIPLASTSDPLASHLESRGCRVVRGSDEDVLSRYLLAAGATSADLVIRTCADRPLVSSEIIDLTVAAHLAESQAGITFSHRPWGDEVWDYGFGVEVLTRDVLEEIGGRAKERRHREHVTLFIYDVEPHRAKPAAVPGPLRAAMIGGRRFDVDEQQDLDFLEQLLDPVDLAVTTQEVLMRAALMG